MHCELWRVSLLKTIRHFFDAYFGALNVLITHQNMHKRMLCESSLSTHWTVSEYVEISPIDEENGNTQ